MTELIGQSLGPYRIIEQIGVGGMATVYKAYQASMDRYVAVKVLPRQFAESPSFMGRFEQEARTIANLEHPHILPVHDYGEQKGITYLVMRFVGAGTLKDLMAGQGPLSLDEALRIMEQVGGALGYAHSQGVIHRDIKPSNVLVDPRGDCFLTDFGIARLVEGTTEFTATGRIVGTPAYMAPEQGMGEKADARSDIYALGIILYEIVTGKVPYEAETPLAVLMKHATAPLPLPRQMRPDLPESVERVILKALSKSPDDRFQQVEDMVSALRQAVTSPEAFATDVAVPSVLDDTTAVVDQALATEEVPARAPRRSFPWLPFVIGGALVLVALAVAAIFLLPRLAVPTEKDVTPPPAAVAATPAPAGAVVSQTVSSEPEGATEPATAPMALEPGWTIFISGDDIWELALQDTYIWAGGSGGLVRWDRSDGSYRWFSAADGLASNGVNALLVDPEGILWVGTDQGLSRYDADADRWTTFDTADGLDSDEVIGLYYDEESGVLVAGTAYGDRGLNTYDGTEWRAMDVAPISIEFPKPRALLDIDGTFVIGLEEDGVAYFDGDEWRTFIVDPDYPEAGVNDLYLTGEGGLLAATERGVLSFDSETETWEVISQLDGFSTNAILEDSNGLFWFAGEGGVYRLDPSLGDWEFYESQSEELPASEVTDVVEDEGGVLWFGLAGCGLSRFEEGEWEVWDIGEGPAGNHITSIVEDGDGNIWVTLDDGLGISRFSPANSAWETFTEEDGAQDWPGQAAVDREGRVWIGAWASARFFDGEMWHEFESDVLGESSVSAIAQDESGAMWFGTDESTIVRFDPGDGSAQVFTTGDGLPEGEVDQILSTRHDLVLANVDSKLMVFDGTGWRREFPDHDEIYQITIAPSGQVWVAGGDRLFLYDGDTWDTISVPELWIEQLSVGSDGAVWGGGWDGLARFDPEKHTWEYLEAGDGLLSGDVNALLAARNGAVWVATSTGLGRYVPPP
jgi:ligand-binding sensor domain-containing protein